MSSYTGTYSPDDNKLRLYASSRLDKETYDRVHSAGFRWAPKQELFVAPMWTPEREDLLLELCGEIDDEDKSLVERQEERSERFEVYSGNRLEDANRAREAVSAIADNIPLGQPILVGHHSERHARKDAERIENGMRKAVKMWKQSEYWKDRAKGAIRHAKYKERPDVRARRIKGIEADKRKQERNRADAEKHLHFWQKENITLEQAIFWTGHTNSWLHLPRKEGDREDWTQSPDAYTALKNSYPNLYAPRTVEEVNDAARKHYPRIIENCERWIEHFENRLTYEKAMLEDQGESGLLIPPPREKQLPLLNYRQEKFVLKNPYSRGETLTYNQIDMTSEEYGKIYRDYKGTRLVENSHRIRTAMVKHALVAVFLIDSKVHENPEPTPPPAPKPPTDPTEGRTIWNSDGTNGPALICTPPAKTDAAPFKQMAEQLKAGVQVVVANQLFPTPPDLAQRMVDEADIEPGQRVLEPSAGTGAILDKCFHLNGFGWNGIPPDGEIVAVEINARLMGAINAEYPKMTTVCGDFLLMNGALGQFDRILMNPPFSNGQDIKHITHALTMLKPGGRLVAICANGPRQREQLMPLASLWEDLPADTFKEQGTGVNTALVVIEG